MICSSCHKKVKDGTSICPHCDTVLDESILGAMDSDHGDEDTPPPRQVKKKPAVSRHPAARKPAPVSREPQEENEPAHARPPGKGQYVNKYQQYWTEDDPPAARSSSSKGPPTDENASSAEMGPGPGGHDPELADPLETLKSLWGSFLSCHFEDKTTIASAAALIFCTFMPWRSTPDGDDMGLLTSGSLAFLLACLAIATIWARKSDKLSSLPRAKFPLATIGAGGLAALVAIVFVVANSVGNKTVKAGHTVTLAEPSVGAFLGVICAAGIVVGGLLTLKRESQ